MRTVTSGTGRVACPLRDDRPADRPQHRAPVSLARRELGDAPASGGGGVDHARRRCSASTACSASGPAIVLASGALTAPFAGRAMDRVGRVPVLAAGFAIGARRRRVRRHRLRRRDAPCWCCAGFVLRGRGERHGAARPHRGGRHVPARAARPRHRAGAVRRGLRRDPRSGGVQPAAARQGARRRRARAALAGRVAASWSWRSCSC